MKKIGLILSILLVLSGLLSACSSAVPQSGNPSMPYTVNATGTGKVYLTPDVAYISLGVRTEADTVSEALRKNNAQAQAVAKALSALGVDSKDIQTSAFNVSPQQKYDPQGNPTNTTYLVENIVYVTVRNLTNLGALLDSAVNSGANTVNGITFDVQDKTNAQAEARRLAVEDAKIQAQQLADAAGVKLGKLTTLNVYLNNNPSPLYDVKIAQGGGGTVPVASGQMLIQADANLAYEIQQ